MAEPKSVSEKPALKIIAPGSCVKCGDVPARVIASVLRDGLFVYQISWWIGTERRTESVSGCELTPTDETKYLLVAPA